jgi:hypothetical protein
MADDSILVMRSDDNDDDDDFDDEDACRLMRVGCWTMMHASGRNNDRLSALACWARIDSKSW